jgi:hypothetical protein
MPDNAQPASGAGASAPCTAPKPPFEDTPPPAAAEKPDAMPDLDADAGRRPVRKTRAQPKARTDVPAAALQETLSSHPLLQPLKEQFGAHVIACAPLDASARIKPAPKENSV